jgi:hypothetical protein
MYQGKTPNLQNGPQGPGDNQPNHLAKQGTDRSASNSELPAGQPPTGTTLDGKSQNQNRHTAHDPIQNSTKCSCHQS